MESVESEKSIDNPEKETGSKDKEDDSETSSVEKSEKKKATKRKALPADDGSESVWREKRRQRSTKRRERLEHADDKFRPLLNKIYRQFCLSDTVIPNYVQIVGWTQARPIGQLIAIDYKSDGPGFGRYTLPAIVPVTKAVHKAGRGQFTLIPSTKTPGWFRYESKDYVLYDDKSPKTFVHNKN